jgi:hypothetical protein
VHRPGSAIARQVALAQATPPSRRYSTESGTVSAVACMNHQNSECASSKQPSWMSVDREAGSRISRTGNELRCPPMFSGIDVRRRDRAAGGQRSSASAQAHRAAPDRPTGRRIRSDQFSQKRIVCSRRASTPSSEARRAAQKTRSYRRPTLTGAISNSASAPAS